MTAGSRGSFSSLAFIGGGQMAEALIKGLLGKGVLSAKDIRCSEPLEARRDYLEKTYGIETFSSNTEAMKGAEAVLLAVKPQVMSDVLAEIALSVTQDQTIVSIAAGITLAFLAEGLGEDKKIIRVMPNTPALVLSGAAGLCMGGSASRADLEKALILFQAVGSAVEVPEALMDAVTGLSGSGPAYCFLFIEALIEAGIREGLARPVAAELAIQTVLGSAKMCQETGKNPMELAAMVTSPGGTTIQGLYELHKGGLTSAVMDAVRAATARSKELGGNG